MPTEHGGAARRRRRRAGALGALGLTLALAMLGATRAAPQGASSPVPLLEAEGVINPLTARYVQRGIDDAARAGAPALLLRLDTPGGTLEATRTITSALLASPVPVVVFVGPAGARAASAGTFVTAAAHVAAMAPGTNLGAAHPVAVGGREQSETLSKKAVSDAAAMARALGAARGRNVAWLERAVRESVSATSAEALQLGVIDLVARDERALLRAIDGRTVETSRGRVTLETAGRPIERKAMTLPERILHAIADPNVAYLLFSLALVGLAAELYSPGLVFPGVVGAVCLLLALASFGTLPINWAGVLLLALGLGLVVADAFTTGVGILAGGGVVAFLLGSLMLYRPFGGFDPAMPRVEVSPWILAGNVLLVAGFSAIVVRALFRLRGAPVRAGREALVGRPGTASSDLRPDGRVRVDGELWTAHSDDDRPIEAGAPVRVTGVKGVTLQVKGEDVPHVR